MNPLVPSPLSSQLVQLAIQQECEIANRELNNKNWELQLANSSELSLDNVVSSSSTDTHATNNDLLFGVVRTNSQDKKQDTLSTFHLAYSTWDGRVLYLDQYGSNSVDNVKVLVILLCRIAIRLNCQRFTWQHYYETNFEFNLAPENLDGWLTLHWEKKAWRHLTAAINAPMADKGSSTFTQALKPILNDLQTDVLRLRLADTTDMDSIVRLVKGLAVYENEPDAANVSVQQFLIDAHHCNPPLFHCILIEAIDDNSESEPYACGMAFFYMGCNSEVGRFLYLEDLFIEEAHRRNGGGSLAMKGLALCGQLLGYQRILWQALDWNTPALQFYDKLGAQVQHGLSTSRFAGDEAVADLRLRANK